MDRRLRRLQERLSWIQIGQSIKAVWDWCWDHYQTILMTLATLIAILWGWLQRQPGWAVTFFIVLSLMFVFQIWNGRKKQGVGKETTLPIVPSKPASLMQIRFKEEFSESIPEAGIFELDFNARRKRYFIIIHNSSLTETVKNVAVDLESIRHIPNPDDLLPSSPTFIGQRLHYEDGHSEKDFPPRRDEKVWLVSHNNAIGRAAEILIEGSNRQFHHNARPQELHIKVTGDRMEPVEENFSIWVNSDGVLRVIVTGGHQDRAVYDL